MSERHEIGREFDPNVYERQYFEGGWEAGVSGYDDYLNCEGIVSKQFEIIDEVMAGRVSQKSHLDVGCAYGFSVNKMRELGWDSQGFDVSEFAVEKAKELHGEAGFWVEDVRGFEPNKLSGLVTATELFEHIPSKDVPGILKRLSSFAEWGCFLVNGRIYPGEDLHKIDKDEGHLNFHSMSWWIHQCSKVGEVDFNAMFELNKASEDIDGVYWVNRYVVVRFG